MGIDGAIADRMGSWRGEICAFHMLLGHSGLHSPLEDFFRWNKTELG